MVLPGHGYGSGATIRSRRQKVIGGIEFTALRLVDNYNGEAESIYLAEGIDGALFRVEPMVGPYGSGTRWTVMPGNETARGLYNPRTLAGLRNLDEAAALIRRYLVVVS